MTGLALVAIVAASGGDLNDPKGDLRSAFERSGRAMPATDPIIDAAAAVLAKRALKTSAERAATLLAVAQAVSEAGGWDPNPRVAIVRGRREVLGRQLAESGIAGSPATLAGIASVGSEADSALVAITVRRRAVLSSFPRRFEGPTLAPPALCAKFVPPFEPGGSFVTRPSGIVESFKLVVKQGEACSTLTFPTVGRHTVELLATGPIGPEVAALFFVDVGVDGSQVSVSEEEEVDEPEIAIDGLLRRINGLRKRGGEEPLELDSRLTAIAMDWARKLEEGNYLAHVSPEGGTLKTRLAEAGYAFDVAGENLGLANSVRAAHFGIEQSPGHRMTLLTREFTALGVGIAKRSDGMAVLVELFARPGAKVGDATRDAGKEVYQALNALRAGRKLGALTVDPSLQKLAQAHAARAFQIQVPQAELPDGPTPSSQIFEVLSDAQSAATDFFVVETPSRVKATESALSAQLQRVGVGIVQGDSPRYGRGRYWVSVFYAGGSAPDKEGQ